MGTTCAHPIGLASFLGPAESAAFGLFIQIPEMVPVLTIITSTTLLKYALGGFLGMGVGVYVAPTGRKRRPMSDEGGASEKK